MKLLTRGVFFLAGVAALHTALVFGLHKALVVYSEHLGCGCGRVKYPAVAEGMVAVSDFLTYRFWIAYPLFVFVLLPLWLWLERRKRPARLKPFLREVEPTAGTWPPAPKA